MQSLYSPGATYYNQQGDLIGTVYHREFTGDTGLAVMASSVHGEARCFQTQNEALVWLAAGNPPPANVTQLRAPRRRKEPALEAAA